MLQDRWSRSVVARVAARWRHSPVEGEWSASACAWLGWAALALTFFAAGACWAVGLDFTPEPHPREYWVSAASYRRMVLLATVVCSLASTFSLMNAMRRADKTDSWPFALGVLGFVATLAVTALGLSGGIANIAAAEQAAAL